MVRLGEGHPAIWQTIIEELEAKLSDIEFKGEEIVHDWRKGAKKSKFDRELFERYGYLKDVILHPKFQFAKQFLEENADFDIVLGDPIMPLSTAVILLFMINKRVSFHALILVAAFIFNINPLYVSITIFLYWMANGSRRIQQKPKQFLACNVKAKENNLIETSKQLENKALNEKHFDHILVGNNISTLYTAALLSKCGHKCCVIKPTQCQPTMIQPEGAPCPAPLVSTSISKIDRYKLLLDVVQPSVGGNPAIKFSAIGKEDEAFTSHLLHLKAINDKANESKAKLRSEVKNNQNKSKLIPIRPGNQSLAFDLCTTISVNKSVLTKAFEQAKSALQHMSLMLITRVTNNRSNDIPALKSDAFHSIERLSTSSIEKFLHEQGLLSIFGSFTDAEESTDAIEVDGERADIPHLEEELLSSLASLSTSLLSQESLTANQSSAMMLGQLIAAADQGFHTIEGGIEAIQGRLEQTIMESGGVIAANTELKGLILEVSATSTDEVKKMRAVGVTLQSGTKDQEEVSVFARKSVTSGLGLLPTYLTLLPDECISAATREQLALLEEQRPRVQVVYWLNVQSDLQLSAAEFVQCIDSNESNQNNEKLAESFVRVWSPSKVDHAWKSEENQILIVEFQVTSPLVKKVSANINRDTESTHVTGPMVFADANSNETDPNHHEYASKIGRVLQLSKNKQQTMFIQRADRVLRDLYPALFSPHSSSRILHREVILPRLGLLPVANTPAKYASKLTASTDIEGFFLTGCDISTTGLSGELQAGWVTSNAILEYNIEELLNNRNICTDLATTLA